MIAIEIYNVSGKNYVDDDVIYCRILLFTNIGENKLVIVPKHGAAPGARRVLKIVADTVDTRLGGGVSEITYNLDGDLTFPLLDTGLDPKTKAKEGSVGSPDYFHGPVLPPDRASPNFDVLTDPLHYVGTYPKGLDGGDGEPGGKGGKGVKGSDGPILEIWTKEILGPGLKIDLRGQEGGDGGKGGKGQYGGNGQMGSTAVTGTGETWLGIPNLSCVQGPGLGGDGGRGGDAGCGGDGGDGGNGGVVKLFYTAGVDTTKLTNLLQKGEGGLAGPPGTPGEGGKSGPAGVNTPPCLPALLSQDGPDGNDCPKEQEHVGVTLDGEDGVDGYYVYQQVADIPKLPGLWF
jgi:hypothetical protein